VKRSTLIGAALATLAAPSFASAKAAAAEMRPLKIGYVPSTLFAPLFAAIDRGYLKDEGFEAQPAEILAGQDAVTLLSMGTLDVAAGGLSAGFYNAVSRGLDVKYVAALAYQPKSRPASALMVRKDLWESGTVRKPGDLRGKSIAWIGGLGATSTYYVDRILESGGLSVKDVRVVNVTLADAAAGLTNKAVDAAFTSSPFTEQFAERNLAVVLAAPPSGISATGLFYGVKLLHDRATAAAVIRAVRKGAVDIAGSRYTRSENIETLAKFAKMPTEMVVHAAHYDIDPDLHVDTRTVLDMQRLFLSLGVLAYNTPLALTALTQRY
jgi:NitT/TauT family transport system substrate-binding protein